MRKTEKKEFTNTSDMKKVAYGITVCCLISGIFFFHSAVNASQSEGLSEIELNQPVSRATVRQLSCAFEWDNASETDVHKYELMLTTRSKNYNRQYTIEPGSNKQSLKYIVELPDTSYSGIYYWQVTAYHKGGEKQESEIQSFFWFPLPENSSRLLSKFYPYAVEFQVNKYLKTGEFQALLNEIQPKGQLQSYSTAGLIYHQQTRFLANMEFKEVFRLLSHVGVGCELNGRFEVLNNAYLSVNPSFKMDYSWYSTGIQKYSNEYQDIRYGIDWVFNPRKYLVLSTMVIPRYQFHYFNPSGELRTLTGEGWSFSVEAIFSKSILNSFTVLGVEIDPLRFPFQFTYSFIKDNYTGKHVKLRQFQIAYLLQ